MIAARVIALSLLAACGRIGFDPNADGAVSSGDVLPADACAFSTWGAAQELLGVNSSSATDYGGVLSDDLLRLYFDSDRNGTEAIWYAERVAPSGAFGAPTRLAALDSPGEFDGNSTLPSDELALVFSSSRASPRCLFETTRATVTDAWGPITSIPSSCTVPGGAGGSAFSRDGLRLYLNSRLDANGEGALFVIERPSRTAAFGPPVALAGIDAANKGYPTLSADELTLYYEQDASPGLQIFEVHRATIGAPFGPPTRPPGFPPGNDDDDPTITSDGRALVFSSVRQGTHDLYVTTRACQ